MSTDREEFPAPKCDKCGAPITTGAMAMICPHGRQCEFVGDDEHWELVEELREEMGIVRATGSKGKEISSG